VGHKYRRLKSSLLQSLERGRPTEIDYLNGYICAKGRELGIHTPLNDAVVAMIKEIEAGGRVIRPGNLGDLPLA
jgi:2-dehydropantoate 2-reductase